MTPLERAVDFIKRSGRSVRTTELAVLLNLRPDTVDEILAGPRDQGLLVTCDVQTGQERVTEYRYSVAGGAKPLIQQFSMPAPKSKSSPEQASPAPDKSPTAQERTDAPVSGAVPKEHSMKPKKPLAERVVEALREHGPSSLIQLAKFTGSTAASLSTLMPVKGTVRVARGVYDISRTPAPKAEPKAKQNGQGSLGAAIEALKHERSALAEKVAKLDQAIAAIEALA